MVFHDNGMEERLISIAFLSLCFSTLLSQEINASFHTKVYLSPYRCLNVTDGPRWNRRYDVDSRHEPIVIEVTHRPSHRLVSHVLAILLQERLNYSSIKFAYVPWDNESTTVNRLTCWGERCEKLSNTTINMEVWMPPGFNVEKLVNEGKVVDCGPLGATARLGIFAHHTFIESILASHKRGLDHWRTLENSDTRRLLHWPTWLNETGRLKGVGHGLTLVQQTGCDHSMRNDCIPLMIDNSESINEMEQLSLHLYHVSIFTYYTATPHDLVKIVGHLDELDVKERHVYFLHWYPNTLTVTGKFIRLSMPDCYDHMDDATSNGQLKYAGFNPACRFQMSQLNKVVSSHLEGHAKHAFKLVERLRFPQRDYEDLLMKVPPMDIDQEDYEETLRNISCTWIRENRFKWESWTRGYNDKEILTINGLFSFYGKWTNPGLEKVAQHAVDDLNDGIYKDSPYSLHLSVGNVTCVEEVVLQEYLSMMPTCHSHSQPIGIVAALCSDSIGPMVKLSNLQRRLVISPTVESATFGDNKQFKYFFRAVPSMSSYNNLLVSICRKWEWSQVVLMRKDSHFLKKGLFEENKIKVAEDFEMEDSRLNRKYIDRDLNRAKNQNGRIFMVEHFLQGTCKILCRAFHLQMTLEHGFVWFVNPWLGERWWELCKDYFDKPLQSNFINRTRTRMFGNATELITCSTLDMLIMARGSFRLKHEQPQIKTENYKEYDQRNTFYYSYTYDAVRVLGVAVWKLLSTKPSALSGLLLPAVAEKLSRITQEIVLHAENVSHTDGHRTTHQISPVSFDSENSRTAHSWILEQLQYTTPFPPSLNGSNFLALNITLSPQNVAFKTIFKWNFHLMNKSSSSRIPQLEFVQEPQWALHQPWEIPVDGSLPNKGQDVCQVEALRQLLNLSCNMTIVVINAFVLFIVSIIMISIVIYCRWKLRKAKEESDREPFDALCEELADLDMPPSNIVLNRPIGHGAFGVVYGGEAQTKGKQFWVAVAVKVLGNKLGYAAKVDFLSEAKLMRNLNHPNIVCLFGVCLKPNEDELYLIMEYMLNGDLKNRLLSRRAQALDPFNPEVQPSILTKYALDIARGIAYLHQQNIIHRDIACRNCLVGQNNIVKLGDFGMARVMTQTKTDNYYRLCKHVELPVRWLSPEATLNGLFSTQSDIWSYGIVLYEIITFGVFPYEELLDGQVVEMLAKKCFSIANYLPQSCEGSSVWELILYCCQNEPTNRPDSMQKIIDFLTTRENCVRPYLTAQPPKLEKCTDLIRTGPACSHPAFPRPRINVATNKIPNNSQRQRPNILSVMSQPNEVRDSDNSVISGSPRSIDEEIEPRAKSLSAQVNASWGPANSDVSDPSTVLVELLHDNSPVESAHKKPKLSLNDLQIYFRRTSLDVDISPYKSNWRGSTEFLKDSRLISSHVTKATSQVSTPGKRSGDPQTERSSSVNGSSSDDPFIDIERENKNVIRKCTKFSTHVQIHAYINWSPPIGENERLLSSQMSEL